MSEPGNLMLTRKIGESIVINDNIVVTVLSIEKGKVRLGVQAPREIPVDRPESGKGQR